MSKSVQVTIRCDAPGCVSSVTGNLSLDWKAAEESAREWAAREDWDLGTFSSYCPTCTKKREVNDALIAAYREREELLVELSGLQSQNEIDVAGLRKGIEIYDGLSKAKSHALLDELERLRREKEGLIREQIVSRTTAWADHHYKERAESAEAERDALKERLERVREWAGEYGGLYVYRDVNGKYQWNAERAILAIIEGKDEPARGEKEA